MLFFIFMFIYMTIRTLLFFINNGTEYYIFRLFLFFIYELT